MKQGIRLKEPFLVPAGFIYTRPNRIDATSDAVWPSGFVVPPGETITYVSEMETAIALGLIPPTCRLELDL